MNWKRIDKYQPPLNKRVMLVRCSNFLYTNFKDYDIVIGFFKMNKYNELHYGLEGVHEWLKTKDVFLWAEFPSVDVSEYFKEEMIKGKKPKRKDDLVIKN